MVRVVLRRLLLPVPLLLIVSSTTFLLAAVTPGDVARTILGNSATPQQYASLRDALGLNRPLQVRYWHWLDGVLHGSLGTSLFDGSSVSALLNSRIGVTLSLVIASTLVASVLGVALGTAGALREGLLGKAIDLVSLLGLAVPNFWLGLMLVSWFAVALPLFPATGYVSLAGSPSEWARSLVLPVVTLAAPGIAIVARQTRDSMRDVLDLPFMRTLRSGGGPHRSLVYNHALPTAPIPPTPATHLISSWALGGSV